MSCPGDWPDAKLTFPLAEAIPLPGDGPVGLAAEIAGAKLQFAYRIGSSGTQSAPCSTPA